MNYFKRTLAEMFPTVTLNRKADGLFKSKPSGFHPVRKRVWRREGRERLGSYQHYMERRREGRVFGNKGVSPWTKRRIDNLKKAAR